MIAGGPGHPYPSMHCTAEPPCSSLRAGPHLEGRIKTSELQSTRPPASCKWPLAVMSILPSARLSQLTITESAGKSILFSIVSFITQPVVQSICYPIVTYYYRPLGSSVNSFFCVFCVFFVILYVYTTYSPVFLGIHFMPWSVTRRFVRFRNRQETPGLGRGPCCSQCTARRTHEHLLDYMARKCGRSDCLQFWYGSVSS